MPFLEAPGQVKVTAGADSTAVYQCTEKFWRHFCKHCGSQTIAICNLPPAEGVHKVMLSVPAALFPDFPYTPSCHIWCGASSPVQMAKSVRDGLPKFKDSLTGFGGSGELLVE